MLVRLNATSRVSTARAVDEVREVLRLGRIVPLATPLVQSRTIGRVLANSQFLSDVLGRPVSHDEARTLVPRLAQWSHDELLRKKRRRLR